MIAEVVIALAVVAVGFVAVVALQPAEFRIARTAAVAASPADVFALVNDFHNWPAWSPYERLDPAMRRTYDGAPSGTGAIYAWAGNNQVGEGRSTITESRPSERIRIQLEFSRPFACTNIAEFTFVPEGGRTAVTWSLTGRNTFVGKAVGLFMNMDKMVGGQFEEGLSSLKSVVESAPRP